MGERINLVRYRNDGDEFHVLWTARQTMRLLDPASNLTLVTIEGISEDDMKAGKAGLLVVDTAEYYGSCTLAGAHRIIYNQLKYSTTAPDDPWSANGLRETVNGFAQIFKTRAKDLGLKKTQEKIRFKFVTNRPFSDNVVAALEAAKAAKPLRNLSAKVRAAHKRLFQATGLLGKKLQSFASLLELTGGTGSLGETSQNLVVDISRVSPELDTHYIAEIKELIRRKALSKSKHKNGINIADLLYALNKSKPEDLLPCQPRFEELGDVVPRSQEQAIVQKVLSSQWPTIIRAPGGVGKSVLARRLGANLPPGSEVVVFDGFAGGSYRDTRGYRHQHYAGLVQIANELASRTLCNLLITGPSVPPKSYLDAFYGRLEQAGVVVRARSQNAVVLVVIDAADNLGIAAESAHDRCFVPDLLQEQAPVGCRIVALARTNRVDKYLRPHANVAQVDLQSFTEAETAACLRKKFPTASDEQALEFHRLTHGNPRVQAFALEIADNVTGLLAAQVSGVSDPQLLIQCQLNVAMEKLKHDQAAPEDEFLPLCRALVALSPPVPLRVLAMASSMTEAAIKGFISDFARGRPIMLVGGHALQFRDEPAEDWFREKFVPSEVQYGQIADLIKLVSATDPYVAATYPLLLNQAGRYKELMSLALEGGFPEGADPVQKREMLLNRVQYALRAALDRGALVDATKLAIRAGEEVAASNRQSAFLMDNGDIVSTLAGPAVVMDFIMRHRVWVSNRKAYAYCALMLAETGETVSEARSFLSLAKIWLKEWRADSEKKRTAGEYHKIERIEPDYIAAYAETILRLDGPDELLKFMGHWRAWFAHKIMLILARRLLDRSELDLLSSTLKAAVAVYSAAACLAIILELNRTGRVCAAQPVRDLVGALLQDDKILGREEFPEGAPLLAVVATAELAARLALPTGMIIELLEKYQHEHPRTYKSFNTNHERETVLRRSALLAALEHRDLSFEDVLPAEVKDAREKAEQQRKKGHTRNPHLADTVSLTDEEKEFQRLYRPLIAWYALRARAVAGTVSNWSKEADAAHKAVQSEQWAWSSNHELSNVLNEVALVRLETTFWAGRADNDSVIELAKWLSDQRAFISIPTWTKMVRLAAQGGVQFHDAALQLAAKARSLEDSSHDDARSAADTYMGLARALLPVDKLEAGAIFEESLKRLDRLGDELYERMMAVLALANRASSDGTTDAKEAYRVARMGELFYSYNDHKFPWYDVVESVANLSPATALAVVARWRDRRLSHISQHFPPVIERLLESGRLTSTMAASLHVLEDCRLRKMAPHMFAAGASRVTNQEILDLILRDDDQWPDDDAKGLRALSEAAKGADLDCTHLNALLEQRAQLTDSSTQYNSHFNDRDPDATGKEGVVDVFNGLDLCTVEGINQAWEKRRAFGQPYDDGSFLVAMRSKVDSMHRVEHIAALVRSDKLWVDEVISALEACARDWSSSMAVKRAIEDEAKFLIESRAAEILTHSWSFDKVIGRCSSLAGKTKRDAFDLLLRALVESVHDVPASSLFFLASALATNLLTPAQSMEALRYSLDRVDMVTEDRDGDGPWRPKLAPSEDTAKALAAFVYAMLADPETSFRWRAAHVVRRLCRFHESSVVDELVKLLPASELPPFRDATMPFYAMHARLYLLIGLARAAIETPEVVLPHARIFLSVATTEIPHVLMQHFAANAALALERYRPATFQESELIQLHAVNESTFAPVDSDAKPHSGDTSMETDTQSRFMFGYDFDRYWLDPLADLFGISHKDMRQRAEVWAVDRWHAAGKDSWEAEPRFKDEHSARETFASHGSYPKLDRYSFYLGYHAMFCAAGELLAERPVVMKYDWDTWEHWWSGYALSRADGKWLADRRSPSPLTVREWEKSAETQGSTDEWKYSVSANDIDTAIGFSGIETNDLRVWGNESIVRGGRIEEISVTSAVVSRDASMALLRGLQTLNDQHSYALPSEKVRLEIGSPPFQLYGWVSDVDINRELDRFDELTGDMPFPGPMPGKRMRRLFGLRPDEEQHVWCLGNATVMRSEAWGDWKAEDYGQRRNHGEILSITPGFLRTILEKCGCDLILKVKVTRTRDERKSLDLEEYRYRGYTRIYLFRRDGSVHTLPGHRRIW